MRKICFPSSVSRVLTKGMVRSSTGKLELEKFSLEIRHFLIAVRKIFRQLMRRKWIYSHTDFL